MEEIKTVEHDGKRYRMVSDEGTACKGCVAYGNKRITCNTFPDCVRSIWVEVTGHTGETSIDWVVSPMGCKDGSFEVKASTSEAVLNEALLALGWKIAKK